MNQYHIRFNKSRGQPGRGSKDHVWRVFENGTKEYLFKHINISVPCHDEVTGDGQGNDDWNFACKGHLILDRKSSTGNIVSLETTCAPTKRTGPK
jgi:hypothetical protein